MAKNATAKKAAVPAVTSGNVPAHLASVKMSGAGVSTDQSDNLIPMARILQKMSPEVDKKAGAQYIKGAEPGDIYVKSLSNPIIKGEDGFLFQPCYFSKGFVEWIPRAKGGGGGGGYVALHKEEPSDTVSQPDPMNPERNIRVRKSNGNIVVETRYHGGFIIMEDGEPVPCVIPFSSSGHTVSKTWMMLMNRKQVNGIKADSFAVYYRMKSVSKTKNNNTWSLFEVTDAGEEEDGVPTTYWVPSTEDYARGKALFESLASGRRGFDAGAAGDDAEDQTNRSSQGKM